MKNIRQILRLVCLVTASALVISCDNHTYVQFQIQNNTDQTLYVQLYGTQQRVSNVFYPQHTACLLEAFGVRTDFNDRFRDCFVNALDCMDSCVVRLNDKDGQVLRVWVNNDAKKSSSKEFFKQSEWEEQKKGDRHVFFFVIRENDLNMPQP